MNIQRRHCRSKAELLARMPRAFRPRLTQDQLLDLAVCHTVTLDVIATGHATVDNLWQWAGAVLTWARVAELLGQGEAEMWPQQCMATAVIERWRNTNRVLFTGPQYQLAKQGVAVMDALAAAVDRPTAVAAADWSEAQLQALVAKRSEVAA